MIAQNPIDRVNIEIILFAKRICILEKHLNSVASEIGSLSYPESEKAKAAYQGLQNAFEQTMLEEAKALVTLTQQPPLVEILP